jgi:hypothetical protein
MTGHVTEFETLICPWFADTTRGALLTGSGGRAVADRADLAATLASSLAPARVELVAVDWRALGPAILNAVRAGPLDPEERAALDPLGLALLVSRAPAGLTWRSCEPAGAGAAVGQDAAADENASEAQGPTLPESMVTTLRHISKGSTASGVYLGLVSLAGGDEPASLATLAAWTGRSRATVVRAVAALEKLGAVARIATPGRPTLFQEGVGLLRTGSRTSHRGRGEAR